MSLPNLHQLRTLATDVLYVTVGFGVIVTDHLRGRTSELTRDLPTPRAGRSTR